MLEPSFSEDLLIGAVALTKGPFGAAEKEKEVLT